MSELLINKGSTLRARVVWPDGNGGALDLTGSSVEVIDVRGCDGVSASIVDAPTGVVEVTASSENTFDWPVRLVSTFRIALTETNGDVSSTNAIGVKVL